MYQVDSKIECVSGICLRIVIFHLFKLKYFTYVYMPAFYILLILYITHHGVFSNISDNVKCCHIM